MHTPSIVMTVTQRRTLRGRAETTHGWKDESRRKRETNATQQTVDKT